MMQMPISQGITPLKQLAAKPVRSQQKKKPEIAPAMDSLNVTPKNYSVTQRGNILKIVSFTGKPTYLFEGIKTKVRGVSRHQGSIRNIDASDWRDGDPLTIKRSDGKIYISKNIDGKDKTLGFVESHVATKLKGLMDKGYTFRCELADVVGGFSGAPTLSLRANIIYDPKAKTHITNIPLTDCWDENTYKPEARRLLECHNELVSRAFEDGIRGIEAELKEIDEGLGLYVHPIGVVGSIPERYEDIIRESIDDPKSKFTINYISQATDKPEKPIYIHFDAILPNHDQEVDTAAKEVDIAARELVSDDKTKEFAVFYQPEKSPEDVLNLMAPAETVQNIVEEINKAKNILVVGHKAPDGDAIGCTLGLHAALKTIGKNVDACIDDGIPGLFRHNLPGIDTDLKTAAQLDHSKHYDLVIMMDTPTPSRVGNIDDFIKQDGTKLVMIDHHPLRQDEWDDEMKRTGISLDKVRNDGLLWVKEDVPAAAEMVAGLIEKILPDNIKNTLSTEERDRIAKPLVAGMMTDSGGFMRGSEYGVESVAKHLMKWADFGKKWLRETIDYELPAKAHAKLFEYGREGVQEYGNGFALLKVPYEKLMDVFKIAKEEDPEIIKKDIINGFKYSSIFGSLRDHHKLAVLATESEKKGELDEIGNVYPEDKITMSFRSKPDTSYAGLMAEHFNGGGHAAASGGRVSGVTLETNAFDDDYTPGKKINIQEKLSQLAEKLLVKPKKKLDIIKATQPEEKRTDVAA